MWSGGVWCGVVCIKPPKSQTMDIISVCVEFHCGSLMAKTFQNSKVSTVDRLASKDLGQTSPFPVIRSQFQMLSQSSRPGGLEGVNKHTQWRLDSFTRAGLAVGI